MNCILTLDFLKLRLVKPTRNKISKEFPFLVEFMVKLYVLELGFRTNSNNSLCLDHVWVVTHIGMILEVIHERILEERYSLKDDLSIIEVTRRI